MKARGQTSDRKIVVKNRRARHNYDISENIEAGIVLKGSEVKSVRNSAINLGDAHAQFRDGELYLLNCRIEPYANATYDSPDPVRPRKLLLHSSQLTALKRKNEEKGMSLIPLEVYFSSGRVKISIGVGKGKKAYDKRSDLKDRELKRDVDRTLKSQRKL
jgi:SsrA-binding protein